MGNPGLSVSELVSKAWASVSTFKGSDRHDYAKGGDAHQPKQLMRVLRNLEGIHSAFNSSCVYG